MVAVMTKNAERAPLICMRCKRQDETVKLESSRTQYHTDLPWDHPDNPNADIPLCRECAKDHHAHWDDMWNEYYAGCW